MTDDAFDEFSFLPEQAADLALTGSLPRVRRVGLTLPDGRTLSGLRYGDAPPQVTFLHGAGLNAHTWDTTVLALGLPALALDLPGHGETSWRGDADYSPRTLALDVLQALRTWTDAPQVLVGHSLGGLTAIVVAASAPELVRSLTVLDITPGIDPNAGPRQIRAFFAGPTDWADRDELVDRALSFGLGGTRRAAERGVYLNSRVRADGRVEWKHHFAHLLAAAAAAPAPAAAPDGTPDDALADVIPTDWTDVAAVVSPLTLIRGDQGYVTEADAAEFARHAPAARILTVPAHHNVHEEIPVHLADLIRQIATA